MELVAIIGLFIMLGMAFVIVRAENIILGLMNQVDELMDALEEEKNR